MTNRRPDSKQKAAAKKSAKPAATQSTATKPQQGLGKSGRSWFEQHQTVAVDSLSRLLLEPASSLLTWSVIGIALALPLCLLLFLQNLQQLNASLDEAGNISLFMEMQVSQDQLDSTQADILRNEQILAAEVITAQAALVEFQASSGFGDALAGLDENPLPAVIVVTPGESGRASLEGLVSTLENLDGVAFAQVDLEWIQRLYGMISLAQRLTTGLAMLLCLGVILVVGNTVRLAIENRRDEIVVVKLVGGTDAYVSRPFLYTGLWYGVGGGLIACLLAMLAFLLLAGPVASLMALYDSEFSLSGLSISDLLGLLMVAGGLGLAGAWVSVMRHLKQIEPR